MSEWKSDPHVVSLRYTLDDNERVRFQNPPAVRFDSDLASFELQDGTLTCTMKEHFADVNAARRAVRPVLEGWNTLAQLNGHPVRFVFTASDAKVIERNPPPAGTVVSGSADIMMGNARVSGSAYTSRNLASYPEPPRAFIYSPDVLALWERYQNSLKGAEPLPSMAYFCQTVLKEINRQTPLNVSAPVLGKLGRLASSRGDRMTARKAEAQNPLTEAETAWIHAALKALILRVGQVAAGTTPQPLTMAALPKLL